MTKQEIQAEALTRAQSNSSLSNYPAIFEGFMAKGIDIDDIIPRENIFTYQAWRAKGRQVLKGEHGVKINTWVSMTKKPEENSDVKEPAKPFKRPRMVTVFHISQTEA